jgi:glycosyltransferase involved in cell wall biosynthesis
MMDCIVFWQRMLTPHMTELARELARGGAEVHYVAEEVLSLDRRATGWEADELSEVGVHYVVSHEDARNLVDRFPRHAVHITQGVRANGLIVQAQRRLASEGLRQYAIMEAVDLRGSGGRIKPFLYAARFWALAGKIEGLLAIGEGTPEWVARLSPRSMRAIPFAYFLKGRRARLPVREGSIFRFIFVGSLIHSKRVDLLLEALSGLSGRPFEVEIVGDGPNRAQLERQAHALLPGRTVFCGTLVMNDAINRIAAADCLVLPSVHDGWGAVVSEAQINGTPVICSSRCGASGTVRASGFGAVFESGDVDNLRRCLAAMLNKGRIDAAGRDNLGAWARCLTAEAGARYLLEIIGQEGRSAGGIVAPWERAGEYSS